MTANMPNRESRWWRGLVLAVLALAPAGCRFTCDADAGRSGGIEGAIDEVGDEVEDIVEEVKEDRP
jgi:hypothetical protein